jgi:hypothetical protein
MRLEISDQVVADTGISKISSLQRSEPCHPYSGAEAQEGFSSLGAIGGDRAYSGHEIELGETRLTLRGVTCPSRPL